MSTIKSTCMIKILQSGVPSPVPGDLPSYHLCSNTPVCNYQIV